MCVVKTFVGHQGLEAKKLKGFKFTLRWKGYEEGSWDAYRDCGELEFPVCARTEQAEEVLSNGRP